MFKILLLICNILNIIPEKDLNAPPSPLPPFPPQPLPQSLLSPMTLAARSGNGGGRQQRWKQRQQGGCTTINQQMAAIATEKAFVVAAAAASGTSWRWLELQKEMGPYLVGPHNLPPNFITVFLGARQVYLLQQILSGWL